MSDSTSEITVTDLDITGGPSCPICIHSLGGTCAYFPPKDETMQSPGRRPWTYQGERCALGVFIFGEFPDATLMTYQEWIQWVIDERNADAREMVASKPVREDEQEEELTEDDNLVYTNGTTFYFVGPTSKRGYTWGTWRTGAIKFAKYGPDPKKAVRSVTKFLPDRETKTEAERDLQEWAERRKLTIAQK